jgi:hypothetical protein
VNPVAAQGYEKLGLLTKSFEPALYFRKHLLFPPGRPRSSMLKQFLTLMFRERNRFKSLSAERDSS